VRISADHGVRVEDAGFILEDAATEVLQVDLVDERESGEKRNEREPEGGGDENVVMTNVVHLYRQSPVEPEAWEVADENEQHKGSEKTPLPRKHRQF
jgi:hypothetical protein